MASADFTPPEGERTFRQEHVDRIVQDRLRKAESRFDARESALAAEFEAQVEKLEAELESATTLAQEAAIGASITKEAVARNVDVDIAVRMADRGLLEFRGDGSVDAAIALDSLLESKPGLRDSGTPLGGRRAEFGARGGQTPRKFTGPDIAGLSPEETHALLERGLIDGHGDGQGAL
jgi:multidrug efflux pump subunit AcrA (membrane-fusion protein)